MIEAASPPGSDPWQALILPDPAPGAETPTADSSDAFDDRGVPASGRISVIGASGGCGATTVAAGLALNTAVSGKPVVLIELDLERGDLAASWGAPAERTIDDLRRVRAELQARHLQLVAHPHASAVSLVLAPVRPGAADEWDGSSTACLLDHARELGAVIVDCGGSLGQHVREAIGGAERVVLVAPATLAGARRARRLIGVVEGWTDRERLALVANRGVARDHLGARGFSRAAGQAPLVELPRADGEADDIGAGRWCAGRRSRLRPCFDQIGRGIL